MPFYTYKCNTCGLEKDFLKSMGDSKTQLCPKCCYNPNVNGDDEKDLRDNLKTLTSNNVMPALSCGMHPGLVQAIIKKFGNDFIANVGGAIHGHPMGTLAGAKAMRQSIDNSHGD